MPQKAFSKIWLLVIVAVVAAAGVLVWWQLQTPAEEGQAPTEEEQPSGEEAEVPQEEVQPPTDETADWKTYRNEEYRYEIKYPNYWEPYEQSPTKGEAVGFAKNKSEADAGAGLEIISRVNIKGLRLKDWWYENMYQIRGEPDAMHSGIIKDTSCGDGGCVFSIFWGNENYIYTSAMSFGSNMNYAETFQKMIFYYQMLSTFRFLE